LTDIFELLKMNKYRLLYFIWAYRGELKDEPGLKAKLAKLFGYKSDGHFYPDWEALFEDGFLVMKGDHVVITQKARRHFSFLLALNLMRWLSVIIATVLLIYIVTSTLHWNPPWFDLNSIYVISVSTGFLFAMAIIGHYVYKNFVPSIPSKKEFEASGV